MLIKPGVSLYRVQRPIRRVLGDLERAWPDYVVTSTTEGTHLPESLHYAGLAVDIRRRYPVRWREISEDRLRQIVGAGYDVVAEADHYHIEWDPHG